MSNYIHKRHNESILLNHLVCPAKYRSAIFVNEEEEELKNICEEISERYEIDILEIGADTDHVHFLIQSEPTYSPKKIVQTIKSITAIEIFRRCPEVKQKLWGGELWSKGYYISTVSRHGTESVIQKYVQDQGCEEKHVVLTRNQLELF